MTRYIKKPQIKNNNFTILVDDREKKPWLFPSQYPMEKRRLKCGDYSIKGYEDLVAIEKKSGLNELFTNLTGNYRPTFKRFLSKLSKYPVRAIVVGNPLRIETLRACVKILKLRSSGKSQLTEETIYYWVSEITFRYQIPVLFIDALVSVNMLTRLFESAYKRAQEIRNDTRTDRKR